MTHPKLLALVSLALLGCTRPVRPDDMSAAAHRHEAQQERAASNEHLEHYDPDAAARTPRSGRDDAAEVATGAIVADYNPTSWHLLAADRHSAHAAEHDRAAAELDHFESIECTAFAHPVRAACPFIGPVRAVEEIPNGIRLVLADGAPVATVVAHMRCHLAFARTRAFVVADCPLSLKNTDINMSKDGRAIEISSRDRAVVKELRKRSSALVDAAH